MKKSAGIVVGAVVAVAAIGVGGAWYTFDARHNKPRIGRVVIGRGRDAVDVALTTTYGASELANLWVWADQVDEHLSLADIRQANQQGI